MTHTIQLAGTFPYWQPIEQAQRERAARRRALVADARMGGEPATPEPPRRRQLVPRLAGALGLF